MSCDDTVIRAVGISKRYEIFSHPRDRLKQSLVPRLQKIVGLRPSCYYRDFWALRDVSFEITKGETVGIVGRNGSGKSTLLQIVCGTLTPSGGRVEVAGRIAPLLELGAGFNPEFTGRENVILNATILGLGPEEINSRLGDILRFADIGLFIDQPVKFYSSGMYARLAFAVAINVDPDVLVVDEALAVGDEAFQRKCFARIERIRRDGATILFVSHSGGTIIDLCDRAILLNRGERLFTGEPKKAVFYLQKLGNALDAEVDVIADEIRYAERAANTQSSSGANDLAAEISDTGPPGEPEASDATAITNVPSTLVFTPYFDPSLISKSLISYEEKGAFISSPRLLDEASKNVNQILRREKFRLACDVDFESDCRLVRFYAVIRTMTGLDLAGCAHPRLGLPGLNMTAGSKVTIEFEFTCLLNPGTYFCNFAVQAADGSLHHRIVDAFAFRVVDNVHRPSTALVDLDFVVSVKSRRLVESTL